MQVVSLAPVPVASLPWRTGDGGWTLSVICKLTLVLEPGEASLAKRHDPIYERERFPDDDAGASLYAPSDLIPPRPQVDVTLVGNAYVPRGGPAKSLDPRLCIATINKKLHIEGVNGAFKSAALGYEFAAPSDDNPVGGGGTTHRISAIVDPNASNPGYTSPGFGPIASHWPARRTLLRGADEPLAADSGAALEIPAGFDLSFFNAAPADQQLPELSPNAELLLEHLHPDHTLLRTRLPNVAPQAFVEREGARRREEATSRITGLWIDTRRSVATLTFHCNLPLEARDEPGKVWVAVAGPGRRLTAAQLDKLIGTLRRGADPLDEETTDESGDPDALNRTVSIRASAKRRLHRISSDDTKTSVLGRDRLDTTRTAPSEHTGQGRPPSDDGIPDWVAKGQKSVPPPPPTRGRPPRTPALRQQAMTVPGLGPELAGAARGNGEAAVAPASVAVPTPSAAAPSPPVNPPVNVAAPSPAVPAPSPSVAVPPSVAPASVGMPPPSTRMVWPQSDRLEDTSSLPRLDAAAAAGKVKPRRVPDEVTELLWFSEEATPRLRRRYKALCERLDFEPRDDAHDLATDDKARARHHHTHFGVLTEGACDDAAGLRRALREAISERGRFTPPLVILRGALRFPFEALEILRATAAVVKPVAGDDKKLKSALEQVDELLSTPLLGGSAETVTNFVSHLRKLYRDSRRALSIDYLDETVERMLLEQRKYQKRTLFGSSWIRALLALDDQDRGIPTYLPEELDNKLPMMVTFNARLIAEAHVKQDQYETHPHALRVITLGRAIKVEN